MNESAVPPPAAKPLFKSKTAIANLLVVGAGALGFASPEVSQFLSAHAESILIALGIINVILRKVTKGRMVLFSDPSV